MLAFMLATVAQDLQTTGGLIRLIIWVLLLGCLLWAIRWGLSQSGLPKQVQTVALVIVGLLILLFLLGQFGVL